MTAALTSLPLALDAPSGGHRDEGRVSHVVALSGGKDSTALALRLAEIEPRKYTYVCTPTGHELPAMQDHWNRLEDRLQEPLVRIQRMTLKELCRAKKMLPNFRARFCTHLLKIVPFEEWLMAHLPAVAYVGLRADEMGRVGGSYGFELFVRTRYPMQEWGWNVGDVLAYLRSRKVTIPVRTDCDRCPFQQLHEWYSLWLNQPDLYEDACQDEDDTGHTYRSPGRDTWPAGLRDLAARFAAGDIPKVRNRDAAACRVCSM